MKILETATILALTLFTFNAFSDTLNLNPGESATIQANTLTTVTCGQGGAVTCIPHCIQRDEVGSCLSYGADFCGVNPQCVEDCTQRDSVGSCLTYGPDMCQSL